MADRLRAFLDHPLDPNAARAILVFASAILLGLTALFVFAASHPERPTSPERKSAEVSPPPVSATSVNPPESPHPAELRQDPQDVKGSAAARRADRALRSHRALQHVPYRSGAVRISITGAQGNRAILRVRAPSLGAARRGWHRFLARYRDSGRSYVPDFTVTRGQSEDADG